MNICTVPLIDFVRVIEQPHRHCALDTTAFFSVLAMYFAFYV